MKKFLSIVFVLLGLLFSKNYFITKGYMVSFNQTADKDIEYQVFYTLNDGKGFSELNSVKKMISKDTKNVKIFLPVNKIVNFRLDFGQKPGIVKISNLKIDNNILDLKNFTLTNQLDKISINDKDLTIISELDDPFIIYNTSFNLKKNNVYDYKVFVILLCLYSVVFYFLQQFITTKKNKLDAIFVMLFGIFLFIPMIKISDAEKSIQENRMLAKYQPLFNNGKLNEKFGSQFDSWFNDRFNGRKKLIKLSKIKENYSFNGNGRVLKGINNWLFYKGDNSLDNFQNKTLLSNEELKSIAKYLSDIDNWCKKNNKSFYYVVAPDKNKIYGENISILKKIHPDSESRANQLINYLNKNTKVNVVYPYDILIKNKDNGLLYYKHDTHWNDYGAYFGYNEIMKKIMTKYKRIIPIKYEKLSEVYHETGDLDTMIDSCIKDKSLYFIPEIKDNSVCKFNSEDKDERKGLECKNRKNNLSVFVFRDSFTIALKRYYNNTFNTVKYEWRYNVTSEDLKNIKDNFDIIILENVERNIPSLINLQFPKD